MNNNPQGYNQYQRNPAKAPSESQKRKMRTIHESKASVADLCNQEGVLIEWYPVLHETPGV